MTLQKKQTNEDIRHSYSALRNRLDEEEDKISQSKEKTVRLEGKNKVRTDHTTMTLDSFLIDGNI